MIFLFSLIALLLSNFNSLCFCCFLFLLIHLCKQGNDQTLFCNVNGKNSDFIVSSKVSFNSNENNNNLNINDHDATCVMVIQVPLKKSKTGNNGQSNNTSFVKVPLKKTAPICICGKKLVKTEMGNCYNHNRDRNNDHGRNNNEFRAARTQCDICQQYTFNVLASKDNQVSELLWHCSDEQQSLTHPNGYDLCLCCGNKQVQ